MEIIDKSDADNVAYQVVLAMRKKPIPSVMPPNGDFTPYECVLADSISEALVDCACDRSDLFESQLQEATHRIANLEIEKRHYEGKVQELEKKLKIDGGIF